MFGLIFTILLVIVSFSVLVILHELGHFVVARRNGVGVEEFGLGFPPRLKGLKRGGVLYSLNLIPLGGFVRMKGESEGDAPDSFAAQRAGVKLRILAAGGLVNLAVAYLILAGLAIFGMPPVPGNYDFAHPVYNMPPRLTAAYVEPGSPAALAGLKTGEFILSLNGQMLTNEAQLSAATQAYAGQTINLQVQDQSAVKTLTIKLRDKSETGSFLGVAAFLDAKTRVSYGWWSPIVAAAMLGNFVWLTILAFGGLIAGLVTKLQVSPDVAGPVGIASQFGAAVSLGWDYVLLLLASISLSLGAINLLPIPALDGGRIFFVLVQKVTRHKLRPEMENLVHIAGFVALLLIFAVVTFFDIKRL